MPNGRKWIAFFCLMFRSSIETHLAEWGKIRFLAWAGVSFVILPLVGCESIGPGAFRRDLLGYAASLSDARKQEILFSVVRMRYADVPIFLSAGQVISGYTLQGTAQLGAAVNPRRSPNSLFTGQGAVEYIDHPTFTFTPVAGEEFAASYIRPLSPSQLLPLAQGGLWIDAIFQLCVQSVGELRNSNSLNGPASNGSPGFYQLIADLRTLQAAGAISLRLEKEQGRTRIFMVFSEDYPPAVRAVEAHVRRLLEIPANLREAEIVYSHHRLSRGRVAVLTRSLLAMIAQVSAQVEVPEDDVRAGRALPSLPLDSPDARPIIAIHSGLNDSPDSYVSVNYRGRWFWIDDRDYKSKVALSILELARIVAESGHRPQAPIISIPAS